MYLIYCKDSEIIDYNYDTSHYHWLVLSRSKVSLPPRCKEAEASGGN